MQYRAAKKEFAAAEWPDTDAQRDFARRAARLEQADIARLLPLLLPAASDHIDQRRARLGAFVLLVKGSTGRSLYLPMLKTAIRDDSPVIFMEDKLMYRESGPVPEGEYTLPFGSADIKRTGEDITLVATSSMVHVVLDAAERLAEEGISAEVIDPRTLVPLDAGALIGSAKKTSRCIVVDEGYQRYGATAELASVIADGAFYYLDAPVKRIGAMDVPVPFSPSLEDLTIPSADRVVELARQLVGR